MKTFSTMQTNVGNNVGDTSTDTQTIIGVYLNNRRKQIHRSFSAPVVNEDYTISVTSDTQDYTLATDFGKEIYAVDTTNGTELSRKTFQYLANEYPDSLTDSGDVERYVIFTDDSGNKKIRFHYNPNSDITVALPYEIIPADLTSSESPYLEGIDDVMELGATADTFRYLQDFKKATYFEGLFTQELANLIWDIENQNQIKQFKPDIYDKDDLY